MPWWIVLTLIGRDVVLAATLPVLRSRGLTALPVTYIGKAATFALMSGLPLILLGQWDALWSRVILACGWAFLIWGLAMYLWSAVLYLIQVAHGGARLPQVPQDGERATEVADDERSLGGYSPEAGRNAHEADSADADPGALAAAVAAVRAPRPRLRRGGRAPQGRRAAPQPVAELGVAAAGGAC